MAPALLALALAAAPEAAPAGEVERRRSEIARELVRLGEQVGREIAKEDVRALMARVPPEGLRCAGRVVPREHVRRDLTTPGAWLHDTLFGSRTAPRSGGPGSLAELLRTAPQIAIAVSFVADPRAGEVGRPCLEFRAKGRVARSAPLCFERRGETWWLTESLYPCG